MSKAIRLLQYEAARDWLSVGPQRWVSSASVPFVQHRLGPNINPLNQNSKASYFTGESIKRNTTNSHYSFRRVTSHQNIFNSRQGVPGRQSFSGTRVAAQEPTIHNVFEPVTGTWQFIVSDPSTQAAIIIDPVLDYDPATQSITTDAADKLLALVKEKGYTVERILETHAHADHLTAAGYLQKQLTKSQGFKPPIGIGKRIEKVQNLFGKRYGVAREEYDAVFEKLFEDDEDFAIGNITGKAIHLPGHTPDHLGYHIGGKNEH